ncbi:MAG TPA: DUF5829 family protein [Rhizomicrobium sp.]|jgi:hypothetical protein|nr:DUF5829 family protein [Rhizomicrobium sp.]
MRWLMAALLLFALPVAVLADTARPPQVAFLNHSFAVLDAETADAIEHSDYLKTFGVVEVQTTVANAGETWRGRYLSGRQTYLEFFGPADLKDAPAGSTGFAISPDKAGGLAVMKTRLIRNGMAHPDAALRTKQLGKDQVPWFNLIAPPGEPKWLSVWAMEYVPSYFDDPRAGKEPAEYPGDISRERYRSDAYTGKLMRDVSTIEIGAAVDDIAMARSMLVAAGFRVTVQADGLTARDADTTIVLRKVSDADAGMRRITFRLNRQAAEVHVEQIGHSTLTVGSGAEAVWVFQPQH